MPLSKIQRNMLAAGSVLPENLVTTATFTVNGLGVGQALTATTVNATSSNITTMAGGSLALTGNASAVHITASGNVVAAAARATTITATNTIVTNETVTNLTATNLTVGNLTVQNTIPTLSFTTATGYRLVLSGAGSQVQSEIATIADLYVSNAYRVNGVNGLVIRGLRSSTSTSVLFFNTVTNEATYGLLSDIVAGAFDQDLNTTNVVRFAGVTATSVTVGAGNLRFPDATQQSTAWTGTVASSQITSVSTSKVNGLSTIGYTGKLSDATGSISTSNVSGLSVVGYTNNYNDISNRPALATVATSGSYNDITDKPTNQSLFTNSNVTFNRVDGSTSSFTTSTVGTLRFANGTSMTSGVIANQTLNTNSTVTFRTINITFDTTGGGNLIVGGAVETTDINSRGTYLFLDALEGIVNEVDFKLQHDIEPYYSPITGVWQVNVGNPGRLIRSVYAGQGSFTGTVFAKDLIPVSGQDTWSTAVGNIGSSDHRWKEIWVKDIYSSSDITGGTITADQIRFNNDPAGRYQTTAWTGTVAASAVTGLATVATSGNYLDLSNKPTSWSTSSITGLSVVGYTNNYNDLSNRPSLPDQNLNTFNSPTFQNFTITGTQITAAGLGVVSGFEHISYDSVSGRLGKNQFTNQNLYNTSTVQFANVLTSGLTVSTGTTVTRAISAGGLALNSAGTASIFLATASPAIIASNVSGSMNPTIYIRGHGQSRVGGTATTAGNPGLFMEGSRGTAASPTALVAGDAIAGIAAAGYDGNNWGSGNNANASNFLGWYATETMTFDATTATITNAAGSGINWFAQPGWTRPGSAGNTRHRFLFSSWTTSTTAPSQFNLLIGSGTSGADTTATLTLLNGNTYIGPGRTNATFLNSIVNLFGVPTQDTAPDNSTLTATNTINFISGRRSGVSGRRNTIQNADTLGIINFNGQTADGSTGVGGQSVSITASAIETFSGTARGGQLSIRTVNSGTNTINSRLDLNDRQHLHSSDNHIFRDKTGSFTAMNMTTATVFFNAGAQITTYNRTYAEFAYTGTNIVATATNTVYAYPLNTTNAANGVTIQNGQQIRFNQVGGGFFKIIMSLQANMQTNSIASCDFWLRRNGVDVPNSATQVDLLKDQKAVIPMDWLVNPSVNDYYEIVYAVNDTNLIFPWYAEQTSPYARPAIPPIIVNVIPAGA